MNLHYGCFLCFFFLIRVCVREWMCRFSSCVWKWKKKWFCYISLPIESFCDDWASLWGDNVEYVMRTVHCRCSVFIRVKKIRAFYKQKWREVMWNVNQWITGPRAPRPTRAASVCFWPRGGRFHIFRQWKKKNTRKGSRCLTLKEKDHNPKKKERRKWIWQEFFF